MGGGTAGLKAGLGAARLHHSRRREFCCLEPGAGGRTGTPRGGSQATTWCCGGSQIFSLARAWRGRILAGPDIQSFERDQGAAGLVSRRDIRCNVESWHELSS